MFDRVFRHDSCQQDVYDATARPLLNNLLDGFNATVFAYGVRRHCFPICMYLM
jgi:kinesin family protein 18/19